MSGVPSEAREGGVEAESRELRRGNSRRFWRGWFSSIDISAMADVDNEHEKFLLTNEVDDAVASNPIGVPALQLALERLALRRITLKIIEGAGDPLIERRFPLGHAADDALGLVGELELIDGQGRP